MSEIDKSQSHNFLWLLTLFDFDWFQSTGIRNTFTNPADLANLAESEESRSSLCLSNIEWSKNTDESEMPIFFTF